eukprot:CAMPEP_0115835736 /NCGR_PEP_ID=MMETSP0287-20121206/4347_1 /TAXON_ID=412157 /ORGANISM="Chrysochromulina rotalis, Strain UIO044" /LENGTH=86 /DNA_ID=CAMNT_0003289201 /DNA_START=976 /DNA_END=1236 /DNA_ORIENTATION=-
MMQVAIGLCAVLDSLQTCTPHLSNADIVCYVQQSASMNASMPATHGVHHRRSRPRNRDIDSDHTFAKASPSPQGPSGTPTAAGGKS